MSACSMSCEVRNTGVEQIVRLKELPSSRGVPHDRVPQSPKMFVYCSTPRAILDGEVEGGTYGRPMYRNNVPAPEGWHSYYNLGWDPRVRRGDPLQTRRRKEEEECEKIRQKLSQPRKNSGRITGKTSTKKDRKQARPVEEPDVMIRNANMRYARLAISNLRPKEQVAFIVDLNDELDQEDICRKGHKIGAPKTLPRGPSSKKNLKHEGCQIMPTDFFDFDREVIPVLERLIGSVCYQARMEVLEEEEYKALRYERELFEDKKQAEAEERVKLMDRMEKQILEQKRQFEQARYQAQEVKDGMYKFSLYGGVYVKYDADGGIGDDSLDREMVRAAIEKKFVGCLNSEVEKRMNTHYESLNFLDGLIRQVVNEREAEYAAAVWKPFFAEERVRTYSGDDLESSRVPPPTPGSSEYYTSDEETQNLRSYMSSPNFVN